MADVKAYLLAEFADVYKVAQCIKATPTEMILERRVADRSPLVDADGKAAIPWDALQERSFMLPPRTQPFALLLPCGPNSGCSSLDAANCGATFKSLNTLPADKCACKHILSCFLSSTNPWLVTEVMLDAGSCHTLGV